MQERKIYSVSDEKRSKAMKFYAIGRWKRSDGGVFPVISVRTILIYITSVDGGHAYHPVGGRVYHLYDRDHHDNRTGYLRKNLT